MFAQPDFLLEGTLLIITLDNRFTTFPGIIDMKLTICILSILFALLCYFSVLNLHMFYHCPTVASKGHQKFRKIFS